MPIIMIMDHNNHDKLFKVQPNAQSSTGESLEIAYPNILFCFYAITH